jgi:N-acetylmuramoyl-L-alanine amidase
MGERGHDFKKHRQSHDSTKVSDRSPDADDGKLSLAELKRKLADPEAQLDLLRKASGRVRTLAKWAKDNKLEGLEAQANQILKNLDERKEALQERIANLKERIKNWDPAVPPVVDGGWHPDAIRVPEENAGALGAGGRKIVWHTTEGFGLPGYDGSAPHFTIDPDTGKLWQHMPITACAMALQHPSGTPETNRAGCIQVELIGFARDTPNWSDQKYEHVAKLARWIEKHCGVPRKAPRAFGPQNVPSRFGATEFVGAAGHVGHEHVPNNTHWDPGNYRIGKLLA